MNNLMVIDGIEVRRDAYGRYSLNDLHRAAGLIDHLDSLGEKIIWAPDKHLGRYVQKQTGADILCWQGTCIVHDEFKTQALTRLNIHM